MKNVYLLSHEEWTALLRAAAQESWQIIAQAPKVYSLSKQSEEIAQLHLPVYADTDSPDTPPPTDYLLLLIQAGQAALGHWSEGQLLNHRVIRRYMIRAQQGKAQIKHLKTKGKSKLGSRIRLQQTRDFYEEISQTLRDWEVGEDASHIFYHCSIDLWNGLHEAEPNPPFAKRDARLVRVPIDVNSPNFEELIAIHQDLMHAKLYIKNEDLLYFFMNFVT